MTSNYNNIYERFLGKITDYKFVQLPEADATAMMKEWLRSSLADPYIRRLFSSLTLDDEIMLLTYTMANSVDDDQDQEFVEEVLAVSMITKWLEPQVRNITNVAQFFGGKEQKFYSQSNHLSELRGLLEDTKIQLRGMIRDRGYIYNSYLTGN